MNDSEPNTPHPDSATQSQTHPRSVRCELAPIRRSEIFGRLVRLCLKEFREILRDRRTIFTLVGMPLIVYPLLSLIFNRFVISALTPVDTSNTKVIVAFFDDPESERFWEMIQLGNQELQRQGAVVSDLIVEQWAGKQSQDSVDREVLEGRADIGVRWIKGVDGGPDRWRLSRLPGSIRGDEAERVLRRRLDAINRILIDGLLRQADQPPYLPIEYESLSLSQRSTTGLSLVSFIPLMLILMTITGAVYPAIDLTAGERERGTLEALIAAPIPRSGLLIAKYVTVVFVAMLTAVANLIAMTVTLYVGGLEQLVFGDAGLSFLVISQVFGLLILFAAFFSAILLAITSFARSFKEAQAYLIPMMLLTLAPGILTLSPDLKLNGTLAVTPLVNIALLARDLFAGTSDPMWGLLAICSTTVYAAAALTVAASIFGTDAVLYGSSIGWREYWRRPTERRNAASLSAALTCLASLFVAFFVSLGLVSRVGDSVVGQLWASGTAGILVFMGIPSITAWWLRLNWKPAFGLNRPAWWNLPVVVAIGLGMWTVSHELVLLGEWFGWIDLQAVAQRVQKALAGWRTVSPILVVLAFGVIPPIVEEFFFRGLLFRSLEQRLRPSGAILVSSLVFGAFHVVSGVQLTPERFLPSAFSGLLLGFVAWRSKSLFPGMGIHALHNSGLILLAYYQPQLRSWGLDVAEGRHLPISWMVTGTMLVLFGLVFTTLMSRRNPATEPKHVEASVR